MYWFAWICECHPLKNMFTFPPANRKFVAFDCRVRWFWMGFPSLFQNGNHFVLFHFFLYFFVFFFSVLLLLLPSALTCGTASIVSLFLFSIIFIIFFCRSETMVPYFGWLPHTTIFKHRLKYNREFDKHTQRVHNLINDVCRTSRWPKKPELQFRVFRIGDDSDRGGGGHDTQAVFAFAKYNHRHPWQRGRFCFFLFFLFFFFFSSFSWGRLIRFWFCDQVFGGGGRLTPDHIK